MNLMNEVRIADIKREARHHFVRCANKKKEGFIWVEILRWLEDKA